MNKNSNLMNNNPNLISMKGKAYLTVAGRFIALNESQEYTRCNRVIVELTDSYAIVAATVSIHDEDGNILKIATATKREDKTHFADYLEKAETGAYGRALGILGYGTEYALNEQGSEMESAAGERPVDAPKDPPKPTSVNRNVSQVPMATGTTTREQIEVLARIVVKNKFGEEVGCVTFPKYQSLYLACKGGIWRAATVKENELTQFHEELVFMLKDKAEAQP